MASKITIIRVRRSEPENVNRNLQWLGDSLGLFSLRDKDSSCFRVFITLVRRAKRQEGLTSDEIASRLHLTRGTVVHHLRKLMESGIVVREKEGYFLREKNLSKVVEDIKEDFSKVISEMEEVAKEIDRRIG